MTDDPRQRPLPLLVVVRPQRSPPWHRRPYPADAAALVHRIEAVQDAVLAGAEPDPAVIVEMIALWPDLADRARLDAMRHALFRATFIASVGPPPWPWPRVDPGSRGLAIIERHPTTGGLMWRPGAMIAKKRRRPRKTCALLLSMVVD